MTGCVLWGVSLTALSLVFFEGFPKISLFLYCSGLALNLVLKVQLLVVLIPLKPIYIYICIICFFFFFKSVLKGIINKKTEPPPFFRAANARGSDAVAPWRCEFARC